MTGSSVEPLSTFSLSSLLLLAWGAEATIEPSSSHPHEAQLSLARSTNSRVPANASSPKSLSIHSPYHHRVPEQELHR